MTPKGLRTSVCHHRRELSQGRQALAVDELLLGAQHSQSRGEGPRRDARSRPPPRAGWPPRWPGPPPRGRSAGGAAARRSPPSRCSDRARAAAARGRLGRRTRAPQVLADARVGEGVLHQDGPLRCRRRARSGTPGGGRGSWRPMISRAAPHRPDSQRRAVGQGEGQGCRRRIHHLRQPPLTPASSTVSMSRLATKDWPTSVEEPQLLGAPAGFLVEPGVIHRHRQLAGDGRDQGQLVPGHGPLALARSDQGHAHRLIPHVQRDRQDGGSGLFLPQAPGDGRAGREVHPRPGWAGPWVPSPCLRAARGERRGGALRLQVPRGGWYRPRPARSP